MIKYLLSLVLVLGFVPDALAQGPANKLTYFEFTGPVELPGDVRLPPGRYQFKLADETTGRRVVAVQSEDGRQHYALLLSIPAQRPEPAGESEIRFMEVAQGQPPAVKTWWYIGERTGYDFVYPKKQAMRLARATGTSVATTESPLSTIEELRTAEVTRTDIETEPEPDVSAQVSPDVDDTARTETRIAQTQPAGRSALPQTASPLPLIGLLGALSLLAAAGLRLFR